MITGKATPERILREYLESKLAIDILLEDLEKQKVNVIEALKNLPNNKAVVGGASFSLRTSNAYEYSPTVIKLDTEIKDLNDKWKQTIAPKTEDLVDLKKKEEADGTAKLIKQSFIPVMTVKKVKKGGE